MVGSREGPTFQFPPPTHTKPDDLANDLLGRFEPYRTAWDAIGDLAEPAEIDPALKVGGKWGDLLPSIPEGGNYLWHTDRGRGMPLFGWRTRYWSFLLKLSKRLPSWTVQAQPGAAIGPFHWNNRRLTFEELCRIQTFPDGLRVDCGRTEMQRMLGNAVPSLIAEIMAREIRRQLLYTTKQGTLNLISPVRTPVPPPVHVSAVPAIYHKHVGVHEAHPGTGKGRRAVRMAEENTSTRAV
jgi:DNA (cytosine-5)-methyltransferase 1